MLPWLLQRQSTIMSLIALNISVLPSIHRPLECPVGETRLRAAVQEIASVGHLGGRMGSGGE